MDVTLAANQVAEAATTARASKTISSRSDLVRSRWRRSGHGRQSRDQKELATMVLDYGEEKGPGRMFVAMERAPG